MRSRCLFGLMLLSPLLSLVSQTASLQVEVEATLPLTSEEIGLVRIDARLYAYDPFLADVSADLVDQTMIEPLILASDRDSLVHLKLRGNRLSRMDYYISVRVYRVTDGDQVFFNDRFLPVLVGENHCHLKVPLGSTLPTQNSTLSAQLIYPSSTPNILDMEMTPLGFKLTFQSVPRSSYTIEASMNLLQWHSISSVQATDSESAFTDLREALFSWHYYRVKRELN